MALTVAVALVLALALALALAIHDDPGNYGQKTHTYNLEHPRTTDGDYVM